VLGYMSRLLSRTWVANDTVAFQFQRPRNFLFQLGQFIDLALRGVSGNGSLGLIHTFSIASSCFASNILLVTRMSRLRLQACSVGLAGQESDKLFRLIFKWSTIHTSWYAREEATDP
jgi:hypothetical protein